MDTIMDDPLTKLELLALRIVGACEKNGCNLTAEQLDTIASILQKEPYYMGDL